MFEIAALLVVGAVIYFATKKEEAPAGGGGGGGGGGGDVPGPKPPATMPAWIVVKDGVQYAVNDKSDALKTFLDVYRVEGSEMGPSGSIGLQLVKSTSASLPTIKERATEIEAAYFTPEDQVEGVIVVGDVMTLPNKSSLFAVKEADLKKFAPAGSAYAVIGD